ncbi:glycerophosphodiester phosphodiesterase family protein [Oenococcus alcoholitolerans]|uniref:glycerophosphodiester phosphodiesterase family protein n=1 Tax=Oenococcus alcoholitolerans TaxID=931074 RepID=UPI003F706135
MNADFRVERKKFLKNKSLVISHRGLPALAPENTLPAFEKALEVGTDGLEIDLHLTKDGFLVINHDESVDRTSNSTGLIRDLTLQELKKLDFGCKFNPIYKNTRLLSFKEFLEWLSKTNFKGILLIELKTDHFEYPGIEKKVLSDLKNFSNGRWKIIFQSFNRRTILNLHGLDPKSLISKLTYSVNLRDIWEFKRGILFSINPDFRNPLNRFFIFNFRKITFFPWLIKLERDFEKLYDLPIPALITNHSDKAIKIRNNAEQRKKV